MRNLGQNGEWRIYKIVDLENNVYICRRIANSNTMKRIRLISTILFILFYIPCQAQYDGFYKVDNNTYVTTAPDAELYELSPHKYDLLKNRPSYFPNIRDLVDVSDCKIKRLKKSQPLRVLRYTNIS